MKRARTNGDRIIDAVIYGVLIIMFLIWLYPLWYIVIASLSSGVEIVKGNVVLMPAKFTMAAYQRVFYSNKIITGYKNTLLYIIVGVPVNLAFLTMLAYPLSRPKLVGKGLITLFIVIPMFFSGGMIPFYMLIKNLGLIDSFWGILLPGCINIFNVIIVRTYFTNAIPLELTDSASIDGSSHFNTMIRIVIPLACPVLAVMAMFSGLGWWGMYFNPMIFLRSTSKYPLQLVLREILLNGDYGTMTSAMQSSSSAVASGAFESELEKQYISNSLNFAVIVLASAPMIALMLPLQKYFVKGIMIGAIKG